MMVIFLTGLVIMIMLRTLRKDYARYTQVRCAALCRLPAEPAVVTMGQLRHVPARQPSAAKFPAQHGLHLLSTKVCMRFHALHRRTTMTWRAWSVT